MKKKLQTPWFLSLLISIPIFILIVVLLPIDFSRYRFELDHRIVSNLWDSDRIIYADLNKSGYSEFLHLKNDRLSGSASIVIHSGTGHLLGQVNLWGRISPFASNLATGNLFNDGYDDLAVTTLSNDSLYLNLVNLSKIKGEHHIRYHNTRVFLDKIRLNRNNGYDYTYGIFTSDTDGDGIDEVYVSIFAGFSQSPRKLYKYCPASNSLLKSNTDGNCLSGHLVFRDINGDGRKEIFGNSSAPYNISDTTGFSFHDQNSYVMAFNNDLSFLFKPIAVQGGYTATGVQVLENGGDGIIAVLNSSQTTRFKNQTLRLYNHRGKLLRSLELPPSGQGNRYRLDLMANDSLIHLEDRFEGRVFYYTQNLELAMVEKVPVHEFNSMELDLNMPEGMVKLYYNAPNGKYVIKMPDHQFYPIHGIPSFSQVIWGLTPKLAGKDKIAAISIFTDDSLYLIQTHPNPYYFLKVPFWMLVFAVVNLFGYFILNLQAKVVAKRFEERERLHNLQLASAYNQLDPHFTFNVLNAIGGSILEGRKEEAYEYFTNLADLIRLTLNNTVQSSRSLDDEINFVQKYLEIEHFRFGDRLNYELTVDNKVDGSIEVPKMMIQIFVENAIKHGLSKKREGGKVSISITGSGTSPLIVIEDNGIGRAAAQKVQSQSLGKGLKIMEEYILLFNQQKGTRIHFVVNDLYDNNQNAAGTRVVIQVK
ncbi:sensor histidine kinase [Geofilum rubicundum]|uniref:sensor histidine kinase n=1 Tax=Geofilum rubicundum TaxID=472113 RepID=UPI0007810AB7|nr:histidine kinase [Geofilum rubicundum]